MEKFNEIIKRVQKSPETIHIKWYRFLKRILFSKLPQKEPNLQGVTLNTIHLFNENITLDTKQEAEEILKGEYDLLGKVYTLETINWHKDFSSGKVWEKKHWTEIEYDTEGDKKIPWELSKCQHFVTLGLAYQQTKEKNYFEEYKKQFLSWVEENPYQIGINWVTPMECAIRAINWTESYYLFKDEYDTALKNMLIKQLYLHGRHIRDNMEWSPAKENHYLSDCMGLFFIGTALENCKEAESWKAFAKKELEKEILKQVSEDGVDYEASLNYHRIVTEILLLCNILGERTNNAFSEAYKKRLEKMCEFIMYYTSPSGKAPSFGDTDNGRIVDIWDKDTNDHRDILSIASVLFKRGDFKAKGKYHQRMQLLVTKEEYNTIETEEKELTSKSFTDWYIIRDQDIFLMIHCGDIGRGGFGGHGHNDQLSFVFSTKNNDYIIDAGTYAYTSDRSMRHNFRSTASHNTLIVNKMEQNPIQAERPFDMDHKTQARCTTWNIEKEQEQFIGTHKGYAPFIVTREIIYDKKKKEIVIKDQTNNEAGLELNIHLNKGIKVKKEDGRIIFDKELEIETENAEIIPSIYSPSYGIKEENQKLRIQKHGKELITVIKLKQRVQDI